MDIENYCTLMPFIDLPTLAGRSRRIKREYILRNLGVQVLPFSYSGSAGSGLIVLGNNYRR